MKLHGEDYSKRLESFSNFTLVLMSGIVEREMVYKSSDIVSESDLSEEQVIEQLLELIRSDPKAFPKVSYEEALKIFCEALEEGQIFRLFEIINDTSELIMVDEDNIVFGCRNIIEFLVNERLKHLYPSDEKTIRCEILSANDEKTYGVGEKCILLTYYLKNGKKQNHIVKVHCENNQICKIEMLRDKTRQGIPGTN